MAAKPGSSDSKNADSEVTQTVADAGKPAPVPGKSAKKKPNASEGGTARPQAAERGKKGDGEVQPTNPSPTPAKKPERPQRPAATTQAASRPPAPPVNRPAPGQGRPGPVDTPSGGASAAPSGPVRPSAQSRPSSGGLRMGPRPQTKSGGGGGAPRKAHLVLRRIEPWSTMKFSFVASLVAFIVLMVAVIVLYWVLSFLGVFDALGDTINKVTSTGGEGEAGGDVMEWFSFATVAGYTALLGAINVVLITAAATIGAVIYNNIAVIIGGIEVTFSEAE